MATKTDVANLALGLLGEFQITSLTEQTKQARLCNRFINQVVDEELRSHPWNGATKRVKLSMLTKVPAFGFTKTFQLPSDILRIELVNDGLDYDQYKIEGNELLTDDSVINLIYIYRPDDLGLLDPLCIESIYYRLAVKIAIPLTDSPELRSEIKRDYEALVTKNARYVDATESNFRMIEDSGWINARESGTNG